MRPDYKNWIPKKMITGFGWACAVLIVPAVMFALNSRWLIAILSGLAGIGCGLWSLWCRYAYSQFSYEGERKLSKQIVEGIAEYIDLPEGGIGLDVGCGSGALTNACAKKNPQGRMLGIDHWGPEYEEFSKKVCEDNAEAEGLKNVSFEKGDANHLNFPDETFDAVVSNYVYHNIALKDKQKLLKETLRVLKKGGTFAIHDIMSKRRYGDMEKFIKELKDQGYEEAELIDTTKGMFMTGKEASTLFLSGSTLLKGRK